MMEIKPINQYKPPKYPRLHESVENPKLLLDHVPGKWKTKKIVWAALLTFTLGELNGQCKPVKNVAVTEIASHHTYPAKLDSLNKKSESDTTWVAPVFIHGDGIGAFGCVVVMPPIFINEQEALQIIFNELKNEEITFDTAQPPEQVFIPVKKYWLEQIQNEIITKDSTIFKKLFFDGYNKELNLAIKFVTSSSYSTFSGNGSGHSSADIQNYKQAAEKATGHIKKQGKVNAAIFYQPMPSCTNKDGKFDFEHFDDLKREAKERAIELLQQQVHDFIIWLKKEKLLKK